MLTPSLHNSLSLSLSVPAATLPPPCDFPRDLPCSPRLALLDGCLVAASSSVDSCSDASSEGVENSGSSVAESELSESDVLDKTSVLLWKYLLLLVVDLTGSSSGESGSACALRLDREAAASLPDARLFGVGSGAADAGTGRDDRRGMG